MHSTLNDRSVNLEYVRPRHSTLAYVLLTVFAAFWAGACSNGSGGKPADVTVDDVQDVPDNRQQDDAGNGQACPPGTPCNDDDPCTIQDKCDPEGECLGVPVQCDDQLACTKDSCGPDGECSFTPKAGHCLIDGQCYKEGDTDPASQCRECLTSVNKLDWSNDDSNQCSDENVCTLNEFCMDGKCISTTQTQDCSDDNPCTDDTCSPESGCQHKFNDHPCDDKDSCTAGDHCQQGACAGAQMDCNDGNPCTQDVCDPALGCKHNNITATCSDGNQCTLGDACSNGVCLPGSGKPNCEDDNPCTNDACKPQQGCVHTPNSAPCQDDNPCSTGDFCKDGECVAGPQPFVCDDSNPCTSDTCDLALGCIYTAVPGAMCNDNNSCTIGDTCIEGTCQPGKQTLDCSDSNPCTDDVCQPATGCQHKVNSLPCDDSNHCTYDDTCKAGVCIGSLKDCADGNVCTTDTCNPQIPGGCVHSPNSLPCNDADPCTLGDLCAGSKCQPGPSHLLCDDQNVCTEDTCKPGTGCVFFNVVAWCDDGNECTQGDYCSAGECVSGANSCICQFDPDCLQYDDGDLCNGYLYCDKSSPVPKDWTCKALPGSQVSCDQSQDSECLITKCLPYSGQCVKTPINNGEKCEDGNKCTSGDQCNSGTCIGQSTVVCDDLNPCTDDACSPGAGCLAKPVANGTPCGQPGWQCHAGACLKCVPDCITNECGTDGCGSTCGTCQQGLLCESGKCIEVGLMDCKGNAEPSYPTCGDITFQGCCNSGRVYYCEDDELYCIDCKAGATHCGWDFEYLFYNCGNNAVPDPTGKHPMECADCLPPCPAGYACSAGQCLACVPDCAGKECGPDGCNGSCGPCPTGESCQNGQCVSGVLTECKGFLEPSYPECGAIDYAGCCDANGRVLWCDENALYCADCAVLNPQCGWDGEHDFYDCGMNGGEDPSGAHPKLCDQCIPACWPGFKCVQGQCVPCLPQCAGKECGPDGCGSNCGVCQAGYTCSAGKCKSTSACGTVTEAGKCEGETVVWCQNNQLKQLDCAAEGKTCKFLDQYGKHGCAVDCGDVTEEGECDATELTSCTADGAETIDCADFGLSCGWDDDSGKYACVSGCGAIDYYGKCDGDTLYYCSSPYGAGGELVVVNCDEFGLTCGLEGEAVGYDCIDSCGGVTQSGYCDGDVWYHCDVTKDPPKVVQMDCALLGQLCGIKPNGDWGCVAPDPGGDMLVSGVITYDKRTVNQSGFGPTIQVPARQVKVTLWDTVGTTQSKDDDVALASGFTNDSGGYSLSHGTTQNKIYVVAYAHWGQGAKSLHVDVEDSSGWLSSWATVAASSDSFTPGPQVTKSFHITVAGASGGFNILNQMTDGWYFANEHIGPPPSVWVQWDGPTGYGYCWSGSYYDPKEQYIHIANCSNDPDEFDDSVVLHEFAHHVSFSMSIDNNPGGPHWVEWTVDPRMAWSEGFASFFGQAVLQQPVYIDASEYDALVFDLEGASEMCPAKPYLGMNQDICEALVAGALWDIRDDLNTGSDTLSEGADEVMDVLGFYYPDDSWQDRGVSGVDFVDFLDGWFCRGHQQFNGLYKLIVDGAKFPYDFEGPCSDIASPVQIRLELVRTAGESLEVVCTVESAVNAADVEVRLYPEGGARVATWFSPPRFSLKAGETGKFVFPIEANGRGASLAAVASYSPAPALRYSDTAVVHLSPRVPERDKSYPGRLPDGTPARVWPAQTH